MLWLMACTGMPGAIPDEPGHIADSDDVRRLWLPASPDNLGQLYVMSQAVEGMLDPGCPVVTSSEVGFALVGGCTDGAGNVWSGEAEHVDREDGGAMTWIDLSWTTPQGAGASLDGAVEWQRDGDVIDVDATVAIDWTDGAEALIGWVDARFDYVYDNADYTVENGSGRIGLGHWGVADLSFDRVHLGRAVNCDYPSDGWLFLEGDNGARLTFGPVEDTCAPCPTWTLDDVDQGVLCAPLPDLELPPLPE